MRPDTRQVLIARATASLDYGRHLIGQAEQSRNAPHAGGRTFRIGVMAAEQLIVAARALETLAAKGLIR